MLNNTANNASGKFTATGATAGSGTGTGTLNIVDEMARKVRDTHTHTRLCISGFPYTCFAVCVWMLSGGGDGSEDAVEPGDVLLHHRAHAVGANVHRHVRHSPRLSIHTTLHLSQRHFHSRLPTTAHTGYWCGRNKSDETLAKAQGRNFLAVDVRLSHMPDRPLFR